MSDFVTLLILAGAAALIVALGWWLLIESEGVYLGRRVVIWLYDLYAGRYDDIKHFRRDYDHQFLAQPIMNTLARNRSPLILDVATGTGRLPLAMLRHAQFKGRVIGADLSRKMLDQAAPKFGNDPRVSLLVTPAEKLPFGDATFDVVTCLEALEFMGNPRDVLREMLRVLRPGGFLLITNRISTRLMPGKTFTPDQIIVFLEHIGLERIRTEQWQVDYDKVWAFKRGEPLT